MNKCVSLALASLVAIAPCATLAEKNTEKKPASAKTAGSTKDVGIRSFGGSSTLMTGTAAGGGTRSGAPKTGGTPAAKKGTPAPKEPAATEK